MCSIHSQIPLFLKCIFYHKAILKTVECSKLETNKHKTKEENVKAEWNDQKKKKKKKVQNVIDLLSWVRRDTNTATAFPLN